MIAEPFFVGMDYIIPECLLQSIIFNLNPQLQFIYFSSSFEIISFETLLYEESK